MPVQKIQTTHYPIETGPLAECSIKTFFDKPENKKIKIFILLDEHTLQHCFPVLVNAVSVFAQAEIIEIESGEANKNLEICTHIWKALTELGADRESVLVNLGGGVITDMGGFIAGIYKRGIRFINIPTTLLSQVDASVGGKTGIDMDNLKNHLGLFNTPEAVYVDPSLLKTLPKREIISGFAEIIKHALIADRSYWDKVKKTDFSDSETWQKIIIPSIKIKNDIVNADPDEKGLRKILNFGHTIGHAVESFSLESATKELTHGEAVAIGIIGESYLSYKHHQLNKTDLEDIVSFIKEVYPYFPIEELAHHRILELMKNDKKNKNNQINFTLLKGIGSATFDNFIPASEIKDALNYYKSVYEF